MCPPLVGTGLSLRLTDIFTQSVDSKTSEGSIRCDHDEASEEATGNPPSCEAENEFFHFPQPVLVIKVLQKINHSI